MAGSHGVRGSNPLSSTTGSLPRGAGFFPPGPLAAAASGNFLFPAPSFHDLLRQGEGHGGVVFEMHGKIAAAPAEWVTPEAVREPREQRI